jgi:pyruvate dehydrogenase E2 component (dihydrolipoamide acetyltransferase)
MSIDIVIPQVGEAVAEVTLVRWLKNEGDIIKIGEPIFEVDTDKAIVEVEAFAEGTLLKILVPEGSPVMPQQVVGTLEPLDEFQAQPQPVKESAQALNEIPQKRVSPLAERIAADMGIDINQVKGSSAGGRVTADDVRSYDSTRLKIDKPAPKPSEDKTIVVSPKARRLAKEFGIDISNVTGTGIDGMITVNDIETASEQAPEISPEIIPLSKLRQTVAIRMLKSKQQVPHFYLMVDVNMSNTQLLRKYCVEKLGWNKPPTFTDIIVRACALSLAELPSVNVIYKDKSSIQRKSVDIGIAVALEEGLIAPALSNADKLDLKETSQEVLGLTERARVGKLRNVDLAQKSMVVSNLGMYGIDAFIAIIDMPDPMILAIGQVADKVVPVNGEPAILPMCTMTLSVDHRILDGVKGSEFLKLVKYYIENPFELLR